MVKGTRSFVEKIRLALLGREQLLFEVHKRLIDEKTYSRRGIAKFLEEEIEKLQEVNTL